METFSALLVVSGEFSARRPMTLSFDVFFDLGLIKGLSRHLRGWWFEMLSQSLWRHCNDWSCTKGLTDTRVKYCHWCPTPCITRTSATMTVENTHLFHEESFHWHASCQCLEMKEKANIPLCLLNKQISMWGMNKDGHVTDTDSW